MKLKLINSNILVSNIRGNIDTRIKKMKENHLDGIILAAAGIKSLNLNNIIKQYLNTDEMLPAAGQGVIAVQCRKDSHQIKNILEKISDDETMQCAMAEKEMLKVIGGDCDTAVGSFASLEKNMIKLKVQLFSDDGKKSFNCEKSGNKNEYLKIGKKAGEEILELAGEFFKK